MSLRDRVRAQLDRLRDALPGTHGRMSFAQEGEDLILARIFGDQARGTYVDVGAHHPERFSNTLLLHRRGWRGVNIDAAPGSMAAFRKARPHDINLEVGVAATVEDRDFYVFDEPALDTFDAARAKQLDAPPYKLVRTVVVACKPLAEILREHAIADIDLLTIDVEGYDLEVVKTLDWTTTHPRVVITEQWARDLEELVGSELHAFMTARGYRLVAKTFGSLFYVATPRA